MQLVMVGMGMTDPEDVILIRIETCKSQLFESIDDLLLHLRSNIFTRRERKHARCVGMFEG